MIVMNLENICSHQSSSSMIIGADVLTCAQCHNAYAQHMERHFRFQYEISLHKPSMCSSDIKQHARGL